MKLFFLSLALIAHSSAFADISCYKASTALRHKHFILIIQTNDSGASKELGRSQSLDASKQEEALDTCKKTLNRCVASNDTPVTFDIGEAGETGPKYVTSYYAAKDSKTNIKYVDIDACKMNLINIALH